MGVLALGAFLVVPLVLLGLLVFAILAAVRHQKQRVAGLQGLARQREWRFTADGRGLESRFPGDPFGRGGRRHATNVVEGRYEGRPFLAFDYSYVTRSGDHSTTHSFSVVTMHLGQLGCPAPMLQVSPQGSLGRFFSGLFGTDFQVGAPGFDEAFHVRTDSPQFALDVLHPGLTAMLGTYQDRAWRLQGDSLLMFRSGRHTPQEIDAVLWSMKAILDQVPGQVWGRLQGG